MSIPGTFPRSKWTGWLALILIVTLVTACSDKEWPSVDGSGDGPVQITDISFLKEMNGNQPAHEGEEVTIQGVVTVGTGVIVSGRYMKFHIQDETGGVYVFADTEAKAMVSLAEADKNSFEGIEVYEGDLVRIGGTIGSHDGMIEFYPFSGGSVSVRNHGQNLPVPHVFASVDDIYASLYDYVGDLVRINGVRIQGDPSEVWPEYGQKAKGIPLMTVGDVNTLYADIYPGSGIPGSNDPEGAFDLVGVLHRDVAEGDEVSYIIYPRGLYDINPEAGAPLTGYQLSVYKSGQQEQAVNVSVGDLPQCMYDTGREDGPGPEPVVTLASFIVSQVVTDPKNWVYKIVARDGRQPFETLEYNQMKSGLLYEDAVEKADVLNSFFYPGMELSQIFYLNDLAEIVLYPLGGGPQPGEAVHGEGINLIIDGETYPLNFADLPNPGLTERPLADFVPDNIISMYTMNDSFSYDQIRVLYDYRLVPFGEKEACFPLTWDEIDPAEGAPMVNLEGGVPVVTVPGCGEISDLFTIEMVRKVIVDDGIEEQVFYWKDLPSVEVEGEQVVFLDELLDVAGLSEAEKVENDYLLFASDEFGTYFPYGHHHVEDMYFRPLGNNTFVTDDNPEMPAYGGRYSVKALLKVETRSIPQEAPSLFVDGLGWLSDPESGDTCNGCHVKRGSVVIPVNCADCHAAGRR